ncbi:MAG: hypothetical protein ACTHJT_03360 [Cytophaga sp.]|uniref:hypothetical protein n=1 Tax=Cytophaga sp. TaxID=29535 RepID=UPI003F803D20
MNLQDELFDLIENYLNGDMPEAERLAFEERIAQDTSLADRVTEVRAANEAIYYASLAELKNTIGNDLKNIKYKPPVNWKKTGTITLLSLALLSGVTTYFISTNKVNITDPKGEDNKITATENINKQKNTPVTSKESLSSGENGFNQSITKAPIDTLHNNQANNQQSNTADVVTKSSTTEKNIVSENTTQHNPAESTDKKDETVTVNEEKNPCNRSFKINTEASCREKETGSISIISDGAYSYTFQVDMQSNKGTKGNFVNLPAGAHEILVTYGKECAYKTKAVIADKWCAMNTSYSFNPDYNEKWKPVYESGASGTILIYDKSGKEIYSLPFGSGNEEWIGNDRQGSSVPVGIYIAFIHYSDGRKEKVDLTIVR